MGVGCRKRAVGCWNRSGALKTGAILEEIYILIPSSLRRRFQQTQEDVSESYTILALIPTLSEQILNQMNIEALTQELQSRSKSQKLARKLPQVEPSSLASSIVDLQDTRSDVESAASHTSTSFDEVNGEEHSVNELGLVCFLLSQVKNLTDHFFIQSESIPSTSTASDSTDTRTKGELWNEVKMLSAFLTSFTLYPAHVLSKQPSHGH
jgi:peroxin-3